MSSSDPERIRAGVRRVFRADGETGYVRSLESFQALFPGHRDVVADEFARLSRADDDSEQATLDGEIVGGLAPEPAPAAEWIGSYRLIRELGQGGQATVYLAEDSRLSRRVALKVLPRGFDPGGKSLKRLKREAEITSRLDHPGICAVYESGVSDGTAYIAMRYVEGRSLHEQLDAAKGRLPDARSAPGSTQETRTTAPPTTRNDILGITKLVEQVARTLHVAHEAGLVHRDIKPGNIMVSESGEPVILDFGLAREEVESADSENLTMTGALMGTPAYMSPEQLMAQRVPLDRRTDVYSLGVALYECLTLQLPFQVATRAEMYQKILASEPESPRKINPAIAPDLAVIVATALEKDRDQRYLTALAFAEDLRRFRENLPILAKPVGPVARLGRWVQRRPAVAASVFGIFLALAAGLTVSLYLLGETKTALEQVETAKTAAEVARADAEAAHGQVLDALAAEQEALRRNRALALASASAAAVTQDPMRALLLAREAGRTQMLPEVVTQLRLATASSYERATLTGHTAGLHDVVVSPTGDLVMTLAQDPIARVWDLDGRLVVALEGHTDKLADGAISRRGTLIATASADETARLWNTRGTELAVLRGHDGWVEHVAFSPAGDRVLTGSADGTARLWDLDGNEIAVLGGAGSERDRVLAARYSPNGKRIVIGHTSGLVSVWDAEGTLVRRLQGSDDEAGHAAPISSLAFAPRGGRFLTGSADGRVIVRSSDGNPVVEVRCEGAQNRCATFAPDGLTFATAGNGLAIEVWDMKGTRLAVCRGHLGAIDTLEFAPQGDQILSSSQDATARLWTPAGHPMEELRGHAGYVTAARFTPDGSKVVTVSEDRTAKVWDPHGLDPQKGEVSVLRGHRFALSTATFSPSGEQILTASLDRRALLWDRSGKQLAELKGHRLGVVSAVFSSDGSRILTSGANLFVETMPGTARLWDTTGGVLAVLKGHEGGVSSAIFSPEQDRIVTTSADGTVRLWDLDGNQLSVLCELAVGTTGVTYTPDGQVLVVTSRAGDAVYVSLDGEVLSWFEAHGEAALRPVFSPDGQRLLTPSADHTAKLWDLRGNLLTVFRGHSGWVLSAVFSPDGQTVLTASSDGTARVWDLDGHVLDVLTGHRLGVTSASYSPSGDRILTSSADFTARLSIIDAGDLLDLASQRVTRDFTLEERRRYAGYLGDENARILAVRADVEARVERLLLVADVRDELRADASLSEEDRALALEQSESVREAGVDRLNAASWELVKDAGGEPDDYRRGLRWAEAAVRAAPGSVPARNTLGVAQYRVGDHEAAVATLTVCDQANSGSAAGAEPTDVAFLAMATHRLGRREAAQSHLQRLRTLMRHPTHAAREELVPLLTEAESTVRDAAPLR